MAAVNSGKIICVGMYWSGKVETIDIRDKKNPSGPRRTFHIARETVLGENDPLTVSRFLKDDEDPTKWVPAAKKMEKVVVVVIAIEDA